MQHFLRNQKFESKLNYNGHIYLSHINTNACINPLFQLLQLLLVVRQGAQAHREQMQRWAIGLECPSFKTIDKINKVKYVSSLFWLCSCSWSIPSSNLLQLSSATAALAPRVCILNRSVFPLANWKLHQHTLYGARFVLKEQWNTSQDSAQTPQKQSQKLLFQTETQCYYTLSSLYKSQQMLAPHRSRERVIMKNETCRLCEFLVVAIVWLYDWPVKSPLCKCTFIHHFHVTCLLFAFFLY